MIAWCYVNVKIHRTSTECFGYFGYYRVYTRHCKRCFQVLLKVRFSLVYTAFRNARDRRIVRIFKFSFRCFLDIYVIPECILLANHSSRIILYLSLYLVTINFNLDLDLHILDIFDRSDKSTTNVKCPLCGMSELNLPELCSGLGFILIASFFLARIVCILVKATRIYALYREACFILILRGISDDVKLPRSFFHHRRKTK